MRAPLALQGVTDGELAASVPGLAQSEARKLLASIHRDQPLTPRPGLPRASIERVLAVAHLPTLDLLGERASQRDPFRAHLLAAPDGSRLECVAMPLERPGRISICVSSQVGCALACRFCATGRLGLTRNLHTWEIVEQVRVARRGLPPGSRVHGVVFQGMGEPLANLDRVAAAIAVLTAPYALAIDARAITVSTAGLPEGIRRLAHLAPRVRLALSIGSPDPDLRAHLIPISQTHPLDTVLEAAIDHAHSTGLAPLWALTLLEGLNDTPDQARALAKRAHQFRARTGQAPRVTVIDYNSIDHTGPESFRPSGQTRTAAYRDALAAAGIHSHHRYSGGQDIAAACGQLAARGGF
jgi:23S rRNA (adenine2503-C2)-methyltransferase